VENIDGGWTWVHGAQGSYGHQAHAGDGGTVPRRASHGQPEAGYRSFHTPASAASTLR
jgi:hypothetical protein